MKKIKFLHIAAILICLILPRLCMAASMAQGEEINVSRFSLDGLKGWETRSFKGLTDYRLVKEKELVVVKATSRSSAAGLIRKISFDPANYRYLRWSWKIAQTIRGGDEKTKGGDDYAARLYIIFPGRFFWQMKAISYVWANRIPKGDRYPNPYTSNVKMMALESGDNKAGEWMSEERDLFADYRLLFGDTPQNAEGIAIMTDSDNTGTAADAWFGEITLSTREHKP